MGVNYNAARFLIHAKSLGVDFARTLTLGRQSLLVTARDLSALLRESGEQISLSEVEQFKRVNNGYSEGLFERLGSKSVVSVDASDYESPTLVHDMNRPVPESMHQSFSVVFDGGTLEHVFDFPTAIRSCMESLELGGHFISTTPVNNQMGHGFYQFSPELMYRVFSPENGFEVRCMYLSENCSPFHWYEAFDPKAVQSRVVFVNFRETYLLLVARRNRICPLFTTTPQQSDYVTAWDKGHWGPKQDQSERLTLTRRLLPNWLKAAVRPVYMLMKEIPLLFPSRRMPKRFYRKVPRISPKAGQGTVVASPTAKP